MNPALYFRIASLSLCSALLGVACPQSLFAAGDSNSEAVYDLRQVDQMPQMSGMPTAPIFPSELKKAGVQSGKITIQFVVGADGKVRDAEWYATSNPGFIKSGIEALKKWQFGPARKGGKKVAVRMLQPVMFGSGGNSAKKGKTDKTMKSATPTKPGVSDFGDFPKISGQIYNAAIAVDKKPEARDGNAAPVAPKSLGGITCAARIFYVVDIQGKVIHARAVSANNDAWRETCEAAVRNWEFSPAIKAGNSVYCGMETEFTAN